ncbi:MAG: adenylate/guanylate cyclase domain-containing protein, partial [Bacteroidota bacterium]
LAERMGNEHYYSWLNQFFYDLTVPTLETKAEIYQYVGDEVVFTWKARSGIRKNRCLELFYRIKGVVHKHKSMYEEKFGEVPVFKAGMHVGMAVSAEVGYLKKSIVYSGDVLNATARIQSLCNKHEAEMLISQQLADRLNLKDHHVQSLGTVALRGREESLELVKVEPPSGQPGT